MSAGPVRHPGRATAGAVLLVVSGLVSATIVVGVPAQKTLSSLLWLATIWFAVRAARGRRTARTTACVLVAVLAVWVTPYAWVLPEWSPYWPGLAVRHVLALVAGCAGAVLLHHPGNVAYFDARSLR